MLSATYQAKLGFFLPVKVKRMSRELVSTASVGIASHEGELLN
jgi:hypothetical protein